MNALKPIFDKEKIEAGFEIASEASRQVGQFLTNRAQEKQQAEKALATAIESGRIGDTSTMSALMDDLQRAQDWSAGGKYGLILTAMSGAAGANVAGSAGAFVQAAAVNYLQGLAAGEVKRIADLLGSGVQAEVARAALHSIVGCAGAAGQGAACTSGALGAGAGSVLNSLMGSPTGQTAEQVEARRNLVTSLVSGIASVAGTQATTANMAATLETSQNWGAIAAPAIGAAVSKCATNVNCQRAVTYVADKSVYVAVQMKDGAIYVGSAALAGVVAASDSVGTWVSEFVGSVGDKDSGLPGKPGDVVHVVTPPPLPSDDGRFGVEIPGRSGDPIGLIAIPGNESDGPTSGSTTVTPLPEVRGPELIFSDTQADKEGKYQPNQGAVGNMGEFFKQPGFGSEMKDNAQKTNQIFQGQRVYQATDSLGDYIQKGDKFYLDGLHKDHIEVFDAKGYFKMVLNLDGSRNESKTRTAFRENRRLPK